MSKTILTGVATIAFTLTAPTAFAQTANPESEVEMAAEETMESTEEAMEDMAEAVEDAMDEASKAMDKAENAVEDAADIKPTQRVSVSCPEGTEAQDDGTCMITGDWSPEE